MESLNQHNAMKSVLWKQAERFFFQFYTLCMLVGVIIMSGHLLIQMATHGITEGGFVITGVLTVWMVSHIFGYRRRRVFGLLSTVFHVVFGLLLATAAAMSFGESRIANGIGIALLCIAQFWLCWLMFTHCFKEPIV
jgi:hypothetical protein